MTGKPTVMTEDKLNEFKKAFAMGLNDKEALLFCNVGERTFYDFCSRHPEFVEEKEILKQTPSLRAKMNIINSIEKKDEFNSRWWLERKNKNEFSIKTETDATVTHTINVIDYSKINGDNNTL
jgi:hypothetical protein